LRILSRKDYGKLNYLSNVAAGILEKSGVRVNMVTGMLSMHFSSEEVTNYSRIDLKLYYQIWSKLFPYVLNSGIFIAPSPEETMFISFSHTLKDITRDMDIIAGRVEEIWKS
jgi:Glutamate-1-semialdehyde aminotransferase